MATVRELQAKFSATAAGMKSTLQSVKGGFDDLSKKSKTTADKLTTNFRNAGKRMRTGGKTMSKYVTAPIAAIGTAGLAAANDMDKAYKDIQTGTGATGKDLEDLKGSFDEVFTEVPASADDVANALAGLNTYTGATGETLEELTQRTLEAANSLGEDGVGAAEAFGTALNGWNVPAEEGAEHLDYLFTLTQDYGVGLTELSGHLSNHGSVLRNAGFEMDEAADLFARLEHNGISVSRVMPGLNQAFRKWADEGKNSREELDKIVAKMQDAEDETEQLAIAQEVFGAQGAQRIVDAVNNDALPALDGLGDGFDEAGNSIEENTEATRTFGERMAILKNTVTDALQPVGEIMLDLAERWIPPLIDRVKSVAEWFDNLSPSAQRTIFIIGGIAAAIGPLLIVLGTLVSGIGSVINIVGTVGRAFSLLTNPIGLVVIAVAGLAYLIYKYWDEIKEFTINTFNAIADFFVGVWDWIKDIFSSAVDWIDDKTGGRFSQMVQAIKEYMTMIWENIKAVWDYIKNTFSNVLDFLKALVQGDFEGMKNAINNQMENARQLLENIWNNIKTFLSGTIGDIVGDAVDWFRNLYERIRDIFSSVWDFLKDIWNTILTFITDTVRSIFDTVRQWFTDAYNTIRDIFNNVWNFLKNIWNTISNFIRDTVRNIFNTIRQWFTDAYNTTKNIFNNISRFLSDIWRSIYNGIRDSVRNIFNRVRDTWNNLRDRTSEIFSNIYNNVKDTFDDIVQGARELPGRIGDGIKRMAHKAAEGAKSVANTLLDWLGKGVNGVIGGINWVLDLFNMDKIDTWDVPQYARGTDGHPGGPMVVGDGKGSNAGRELIVTPDGEQYLSPDKPTLTWGPEGTHVVPAKMTKELLNAPRYAFGTIGDLASSAVSAVGSGIKKAGNAISTAWQYVTEPSKLLDLALDTIGIELPSGGTLIGDIVRGGFNYVKDKAADFVKDIADKFMSSDEVPGGVGSYGSGVMRWAPIARQALVMTGQYTAANLDRLLYQMQTESGGNPQAINLWDINARRGTPSKGLMQVIDPTFRAYAHPSHSSNIWDPLSNILASIRYAVSRYGSLASAYRGVGYEDGGIVSAKQLAWIAEGGWAESIISHDPAKRTSQQRIWQQTGDMLGFTDNKEALNLLERIADAVESGDSQIISVLVQLLRKPSITEGDIKRAYDRIDGREYTNQQIMSGKTGGA